jgi:hypothetical protein
VSTEALCEGRKLVEGKDKQKSINHVLYRNNSFLYITIAKTAEHKAKHALHELLREYEHNGIRRQINNYFCIPDDEDDTFAALPNNTQETLTDILSDPLTNNHI